MKRTRRSINIVLITLGVFMSSVIFAQQIPAGSQTASILIVNATAHIGNGNVIDESAVGFKDGKLTYVGRVGAIDQSEYERVIDATGKHVYPGLIAPNSTLGLVEIGAVRATRDQAETGSMNPNVRSIIAYNTDSKVTPTIRMNGVLMAQITPRGGRISGTSSVVHFDAWNWEDAVFKEDDGIHINWPRMFHQMGWWAEPGPTKPNKKYEESIAKLRQFFEEAKAYASQDNYAQKDLKLEAMRGCFDGTKKVYIHADYIKELTDIVFFTKDMKISTVIVGGYDAWMIPDLLKENDIAVMLRRVHALPMRPEEDVNLPFKLPAMLHKAGVLFCLENSGDMETMGTRNLAFYAGTAAAHGLPKEEALKAVTLNTAKILGIDDRVGSLEVGKDATLFISTGDALDMMTNNVEFAFIQGREIVLSSHQLELYEKYKAKYESER